MVTFSGSPPNWLIYFWTHRNASRSALLRDLIIWLFYRTEAKLTILKAKISNSSIFDFLTREETPPSKAWYTVNMGRPSLINEKDVPVIQAHMNDRNIKCDGALHDDTTIISTSVPESVNTQL